jgi:hypothetical protein
VEIFCYWLEKVILQLPLGAACEAVAIIGETNEGRSHPIEMTAAKGGAY